MMLSRAPKSRRFVVLRRYSQTAKNRLDHVEAQLDFRTFVEVLRHDNDLVEIDQEVDPNLEVGAIIRRVSETNAKAPLFNNVKGAKGGLWRMFGNAGSLRRGESDRYGRIARSFGLPATATWREISDKTQAGKYATPISPNVKSTGPCKERKLFGDQVNLNDLPAPYLHLKDGGKYLQTYGIHVLQTPDGKWTNWSIFRGMVHDSNHLCCLVIPGQHNSMIRQKWLEIGEKEIPWALAFGVPPAANLVAALPVPEGVSEGEYVGAMAGRPLDLVKCELSDLLVPANSEIVFEGKFLFSETANEGPFGDYLGMVVENDKRPMPLFRVEAITHRSDAIMPVSVPGRITDESHTTAALAAAELVSLCQSHGFPVLDANAPLETMGTWCAVQIDTEKLRTLGTNSKDFCKRLGDTVLNHKSAFLMNRIILVGEDVDIYDFRDIIWVLSTRCRPGHDEYPFDNVPGLPLTPYMSHGRGDRRRGGKMVSDCILDMEYKQGKNFSQVSFEHSYPDMLKAKVTKNWSLMGFSEAN